MKELKPAGMVGLKKLRRYVLLVKLLFHYGPEMPLRAQEDEDVLARQDREEGPRVEVKKGRSNQG